MLNEVYAPATEDPTALRTQRSGTAVPQPLSWQPTTSRPPNCTFQFLGAIARRARNNRLRVLGKDIGLLESDRQSFPKKNVGVNVHEGRFLAAIGFDLSERPPVGILPRNTVERSRDMRKRQLQLVNENAGSLVICDEPGLRVMLTRAIHRQTPGQPMVQFVIPARCALGRKWFCPKGPDGIHTESAVRYSQFGDRLRRFRFFVGFATGAG